MKPTGSALTAAAPRVLLPTTSKFPIPDGGFTVAGVLRLTATLKPPRQWQFYLRVSCTSEKSDSRTEASQYSSQNPAASSLMKGGSGCYMAMVVSQVAYGGSNILVKLALDRGLNQLVFIIYRHILAMLLLSPFAFLLERNERPSLSFYSAAKIFFLASLGTTIHINVYYAGLHYTSPTVASALTNIIPSLTLAIAVPLGMESVNLRRSRGRAKVVGTLICIGGSLMVTFWKGESVVKCPPLVRVPGSRGQHENWVKGSVLILISYVSWSAWLIVQAAVYKIYPARLSLTVLICFFASLQSAAAALLWGRDPQIWKIGWDVQLLAILYCGVVISAPVYYLQTWCISKKGPVFASMFSPLQLVIVGLFSAIAFGEILHLGSLIGAAVIIVGLYCVVWGKQTQEPKTITKVEGDNDAPNITIMDTPTNSRK